MYFPIGWPKYFSPKGVQCGDLLGLKFNRDRSLLAVISSHSVCLWNNRPRVLIVTCRRSPASLREVGTYLSLVWKPDSSALALTTSEGKIVFIELQRSDGQYVYNMPQIYSGHGHHTLKGGQNCVPAIKLIEVNIITISGGVTSVSPLRDELFVCSGNGLLQRFTWDGLIEAEETIPIHSIPFTNDFESARAVPLDHEGVCFRAMEYSPLLGGFAVVLADGRGGFLSAESANFEPSEVIGVWAKDLTCATCCAVNHRYRLIVFGCTNGESHVYGFDDLTGGLILSHKLLLSSKDYPDAIHSTGGVQCLAWTPDGSAIAVSWSWASHGGLALWSVFGSLLMCTLGGDYGKSQEAFLHNPFHVKSMAWGAEGYNLVMVSAEEDNGSTGDIMQLQFVKSTLAVNPCMSNHNHLFLQSEECLYLNTGDMVSDSAENFRNCQGTGGSTSPLMTSSVGPSTLVSNKQWVVIQIPMSYLEANWPVRYAAVDKSGIHVAVAGKAGVAHYALNTRRWKLFGNISQEQSITCRGGLAWWKDFLIVPCYNFNSTNDEVRFYPRINNLDNAFATHVRLAAPAFLVNVFRDLLLVYSSDCRVLFYSMERSQTGPSSASIQVTRLQEFSLVNHVPHPLSVIHLTLTSRYHGNSEVDGVDGLGGVEALIANVGGWLLMLQKDKALADKEKKSKKVSFSSPVVLASCVENCWTSSTSCPDKRHLMEALWLGCGAQGMKVWLPLFPGNDQRPPNFLSKRIMLPFQLNIYPLAVLFQDAVVLGAANEPMPLDCLSPNPASLSPQPFPFCTLERTTQVYLHHVLRQLLRRNLGQQALKIANTCTDLPYFPHVLELMLHEVLEEEATASEPIPDALLPRVVEFIQEFPQYLETVVHCARKTEVALWSYLFSAVGNPRDLFKECLSSGRLETAASYLIILQNLEKPSVSKQHATILLDKALELSRWEISKDLVRFLRCISDGELDSPPRTPTSVKPLHSPPHSPVSSVDGEDMNMPYAVTGQNRGSKPSSRGTLSRGPSLDKTYLMRTPSMDKAPISKGSSIADKQRTKSATSTSSADLSQGAHMDTPENYFIDTILSRHARLLVSANRLRDLGRFAAYVEFPLVPWLVKERNRASRVEGFVSTLIDVHNQFDLPLPSVSQTSTPPLSPKSWARGSLPSSASSFSSFPSSQKEEAEQKDLETAEDVEEVAHLHPQKVDDLGRLSGAPSEASSVICSMDGDEDSVWGGEELGYIDINEVEARLAFIGSQRALDQIRFLIREFIEAACYDWWFLLGMILRDSGLVTQCLEKATSLSDITLESASRLHDGIACLEAWAEQECLGYHLFMNLHKPYIEALAKSITKTKQATPKDASDVTTPAEPPRRSSRTSVSIEEGTEEEAGEVSEKGETEEEESECNLM
ncbi:guanine nucleotide exchange factor subunit RIC1 isoform X2 [Nematostella vectensis]|uniref:guanine nucleotide exchange factor subunit RIC1 isoform X2 n=1 Tax=Nematostella vectensis TaxID=45351 RepID=UPI0020775070|nr:guanine nucleotide exchange factor subunit RIC1 isoform X2 [Nematostella vectensis]